MTAIDEAKSFCYEAPRHFILRDSFMANSKSKHRRVRSKIRLRWKKRLERKKLVAKAAEKKKK
jgi:hypothetical protein